MATLEQRVRHLFPRKGRKENHCLIETALMFARCRDRWLTFRDLSNLIRGSGKPFGKSALYVAVEMLSKSIDSLGGQSYIDVMPAGTGSDRSIKYKLSSFAYVKIFALVKPEQIRSKPCLYPLKGKGRLKIPPLALEKELDKNGLKYKKGEWLPAKDIIKLVEQKIGPSNANRSLKYLTSKQGISHPRPYAIKCEGIAKTHRWGRPPKKEYELTNEGVMKYLADCNELVLSASVFIVDCNQDYARVLALEERAKNGERGALEELIHVVLNDSSKYARQEAARSLGHLGNALAIDPLTKAMLNDEYSDVRDIAADGLGNFGYRQEFAAALKDSNSHTRLVIASILGRIKDVRAIEQLKESLRDPDMDVQCAVALALGEIGDTGALGSLTSLLECENESLRRAACAALGNIRDPQAVKALRRACNDPNAEVSDVAKKALIKFEMPR